MQHRGSRPEPEPFAPTEDENFRSELSEAGSPILDSVARGKDAISAVTAEAVNSAGSDLTALRADLNGLKDTVTKFLSQVSSEAAKSAREVTSSVADQVGGVATGYVGKGAEMTSATSEQAKTVATEFESMARRPWGHRRGGVDRCAHWPAGAPKLMLFKFLKLFGLDVPANMEAAKASLDLRFEHAKDDFTRMAVQAAVIAALLAFAAFAGAMALGVALIALYQWTAEEAGVYAGLGAVGAALIVVASILAIVAAIRSRSFGRVDKRPDATSRAGVIFDTGSVPAVTDAGANESGSVLDFSDSATPAPSNASASDLVESMAFFLSKVVKYPRAGNPIVDELIGNLRDTALGTADEAIARAADVIRKGDRFHLVIALSGAAIIGCLLARQSQR